MPLAEDLHAVVGEVDQEAAPRVEIDPAATLKELQEGATQAAAHLMRVPHLVVVAVQVVEAAVGMGTEASVRP